MTVTEKDTFCAKWKYFIMSEIICRHFEYYGSQQDIEFLVRFYQKNIMKFGSINVVLTVFSLAIEKYYKDINNYEFQKDEETENLIIPRYRYLFENRSSETNNLLGKLCDLSIGYNVIATKLPCISRMIDVIVRYSNDKNYLPVIYRDFVNYSSKLYDMCRCNDNKIYAVIHKRCMLEEKDIDYIKAQFINIRKFHGENISTADNKFWEKFNMPDTINQIRIDAIPKLLLGLFIWDKCMRPDDYDDVYVVNKYMRQKNVISGKYNCDGSCIDKNNKLNSNTSCEHFDSCKSYIDEALRYTSLCIKEMKLLPAKTKGEKITPIEKNNFERCSQEFFDPSYESAKYDEIIKELLNRSA